MAPTRDGNRLLRWNRAAIDQAERPRAKPFLGASALSALAS